MMRFGLVILLQLLIVLGIYAQDLFFSQYYNAPLVLNPALTAFSPDDIQGVINYRNNTQGLIPHSTYSGSGTLKIARLKFRPDIAGVGVVSSIDDFANGKIKTANVLVSGAYHKAIDPAAHHYISAGLQVGFFQRHADANAFTYPSQWEEGVGYVNGSNNLENFRVENVFRPDLNGGIFYYGRVTEDVHAFAGMSSQHLNNPKVTFLPGESRFSRKFLVHGGTRLKVNDEIDITPGFLVLFHGKARQITEGMIWEYNFTETPHSMRLGAWYRHNDRGFLFMAGWKYNNVQFALSSDFITRLQREAASRSAFEFSIIFTGAMKENVKLNANPRNIY